MPSQQEIEAQMIAFTNELAQFVKKHQKKHGAPLAFYRACFVAAVAAMEGALFQIAAGAGAEVVPIKVKKETATDTTAETPPYIR